jgi:hypothetical protein
MATEYLGGLQPTRGTCLCMVSRVDHGGPASCAHDVSWAGTVYFPQIKQRWLAFACDAHRDALTDPHQLTTADRAELERRRRNWADALTGKPWRPPTPL